MSLPYSDFTAGAARQPPLRIAGLTLRGGMAWYYVLASLAVIAVVLSVNLQRSRVGRDGREYILVYAPELEGDAPQPAVGVVPEIEVEIAAHRVLRPRKSGYRHCD